MQEFVIVSDFFIFPCTVIVKMK